MFLSNAIEVSSQTLRLEKGSVIMLPKTRKTLFLGMCLHHPLIITKGVLTKPRLDWIGSR